MEAYPLMGLIIGYTCVGVFVATAFAVVLDMFSLWPLPADVRTKLYAALVFEVVVICVGWFASVVKFNPQTAKAQIATEAKQQVVETEVIPLTQKVNRLETPVYIQIAEESQRPVANLLTDKLKNLGFNVQGTENVGTKNSPSISQIRFFSGNEQFNSYGQSILNAMKAVGIDDAQSRPSADKSFGGNIEVWLSPSVWPKLDGFTYVVAVNQDDALAPARVHLQEMLLDKKMSGSFILYRKEDSYRTVRLFENLDAAMQFIPMAKEMNNTVDEKPEQLNSFCPKPQWNKEGRFFACQ